MPTTSKWLVGCPTVNSCRFLSGMREAAKMRRALEDLHVRKRYVLWPPLCLMQHLPDPPHCLHNVLPASC
jgi:hypothetical protein